MIEIPFMVCSEQKKRLQNMISACDCRNRQNQLFHILQPLYLFSCLNMQILILFFKKCLVGARLLKAGGKQRLLLFILYPVNIPLLTDLLQESVHIRPEYILKPPVMFINFRTHLVNGINQVHQILDLRTVCVPELLHDLSIVGLLFHLRILFRVSRLTALLLLPSLPRIHRETS